MAIEGLEKTAGKLPARTVKPENGGEDKGTTCAGTVHARGAHDAISGKTEILFALPRAGALC